MSEKTLDNPSGPASEEKVQFVADARLISVLGEQLIGSEKVGILELVKNAYDAGASRCLVTLEGVPGLAPASRILTEYAELPGPIVSVSDDGSGMDHDDLVYGWLRPATSRRARIKDRLREERAAADKRGARKAYDALVEKLRDAHGGRLPLGEKGIGRLATHRLGRYLWLRTKTRDDPMEWELRIDWSLFDSLTEAPLNLDAVELTLRHQPVTTEYGSRDSGTFICCHGGRLGYEWTHDQIVDVGRAINALRSPRTAPQGFEPRFQSPHVQDAELASPLERVPAPFDLLAAIDESGKADIEIRFEPPAEVEGLGESFKFEESLDLRTLDAAQWKAGTGLRRPECGPFLLHVRAWLRFRNWLGPDFAALTEYLDRFGGITIYRDGLATLPAEQGAKVDWLNLQLSQIKKASNISYYHLAGEIELQQQHTLALRDRSSREGMIQTRAYQDLALLTRAAVDQLQFQIQGVRTGWKKASADRVPLRTLATAAKAAASVGKALAESYDFRKDPLKLAAAVGGSQPTERIAQAAETLETLGEQLKLQEDERDGLMEAAGFGLAISVAVHELGKLASAIVADVHQLRESLGQRGTAVTKTLESLEHRADALLGEVKRVAPLRVTRSDSLRVFSVRGAAEAARSAFIRTLDEVHIQLHIDREDFRVKGRFGAIAQVFANLIDNSIYWIGSHGQGGGGAIQVAINAKERTVLVSDTGPGISKKMSGHLFEPFYSDKSPPSGLGLYVCRYYLGQCGARIRLARPAERSSLPGAQFLLDFSKSPMGES